MWSLVIHYQRNRLGSVINFSFHLSTFMLLKLGRYSWPIWGMIPPDNCTWHKLVPWLRIMLYFMSGPTQNNIWGIEKILEVRRCCPQLKALSTLILQQSSFQTERWAVLAATACVCSPCPCPLFEARGPGSPQREKRKSHRAQHARSWWLIWVQQLKQILWFKRALCLGTN